MALNLQSSSIQLKRHTGSTRLAPTSLLEGEFAIDLVDGRLFYGSRLSADEEVRVSSSFAFSAVTSSFAELGATRVTQSLTVSTASLTVEGGDVKFVNNTPIQITASNGSSALIISGGDNSSPALEIFGTASFGEVSASSYIGVSTTEYQTGSSTKTDLSNLRILDFDDNVFVKSDPTTGELTLQFGLSPEPTFTIASSGFDTDRFTKESDDYSIVVTIDNSAASSTLGSFIFRGDPGTTAAIFVQNLDDDSTGITFDITGSYNAARGGDYRTGSHDFTASLEFVDSAGDTSTVIIHQSVDINKLPPLFNGNAGTNPGFTYNYHLGGGEYSIAASQSQYFTNTGKGGSFADIGITASIQANLSLWDNATNNQGWFPLLGPGTTASFVGANWETSTDNVYNADMTLTDDISTLILTLPYTSSGLGTNNAGDSVYNLESDNIKSVTRRVSLRIGASANSASLTDAELANPMKWAGEVVPAFAGDVKDGAISIGTTNPHNQDLTITNSETAYIYIVYGSDQSNLTEIIQNNQNVITAFNSPVTTTNFKYYRSVNKQTPSTKTFTLKTS